MLPEVGVVIQRRLRVRIWAFSRAAAAEGLALSVTGRKTQVGRWVEKAL